ncbi:MAG: hypothetical protein EPO36_05510 [Chloroflexota bacterium]|nr:MAG: hypothetical protein EPO36_05510 [Chloroflexota bacterium]
MAVLARPFALAIAFAVGVFVLVAVLLWARADFATPPYKFMLGPAGMLAFVLAVTTQLVSGFVLAVRRPDLPIGRLSLIFAFVIGEAMVANAYLALAEQGVVGPWQPTWVAWFTSWFAFSGGALTALVLGLVFPDGRLPGRRWGVALGLALAGAVITAAAIALLPGRLILYPAYRNPAALDASLTGWLTAATVVGIGLLAFGGVAVSIALLLRYRRADELLQVQLRLYIASAIGLTVGFLAFLAALGSLPDDSPVGELIMVAFVASGGLPPIALLLAISRYRLYDIDAILSRAFVFGTLTAILAGVYTASIRLFNSLFTALTGENSDAALVITTLVIAATFTPIKRRLETLVERRFRAPEAAVPGIDPEASVGDAAVDVAVDLDDAAVGRIAAAVLADPGFAALLDTHLRALEPTAAVAQEPGIPPTEDRHRHHA